jgi:hypothetical protein
MYGTLLQIRVCLKSRKIKIFTIIHFRFDFGDFDNDNLEGVSIFQFLCHLHPISWESRFPIPPSVVI